MATIYYDLRKAPVAPGQKETGYYPVTQPAQTYGAEQLYEYIEKACSLTTSDVKGALDALAHVIAHQLETGNRVEIPEIGYFSVKIGSDKTFNSSTEKGAADHLFVDGIRFTPKASLRRRFETANFHRTRSPRAGEALPDDEAVETKVREFFATSDEEYLTSRRLCQLLSCSYASANRRLKMLTEAGVLARVGYKRSPLYVLAETEGGE